MTTRAHRRPARVLAVLAIAAPSALWIMASASPALAATGSISTPSSDAVFAEGTSSVDVTGSATVARGESVTLSVDGPGLSSPKSYTTSYSCTAVLGCPSTQSKSLKVTVSISSSNANGEYTASLSGSGTSSTRHFYTNFKPLADAGNLAAAPNGNTEVDLSWSYSGTEPDKAGFEIAETHNGATRTITVPTSACSGSNCGYAITYAAPGTAQTDDYSYTVTALRQSPANCGCGSTTRSNPSASASAELVGPPPPPSPTPTPTDGGTTGGTTGSTTGSQTGGTTGSSSGGTSGSSGGSSGSTGSTTGGTTGSKTSGSTTGSSVKPIIIPKLPPLVASRRSFALGFNHFSPSLGIPKLPPLPATTFPVTAGDESAGGVYQPTLPYKNTQGKKTTSVLSSPIAAISNSIGLNTDQLMKLIALGLVLFAAAAHVRVFLSRSVEE